MHYSHDFQGKIFVRVRKFILVIIFVIYPRKWQIRPKMKIFKFLRVQGLNFRLSIEKNIWKAMYEITLDNQTSPIRIQKKTPIRYKLNHAWIFSGHFVLKSFVFESPNFGRVTNEMANMLTGLQRIVIPDLASISLLGIGLSSSSKQAVSFRT